MLGKYRIAIKRALNGMNKITAFHNKVMPGIFDIILNKTTTSTTDSVIDTLWLADGLGQHAPDATGFIGTPVLELKYNTYTPPTMVAGMPENCIHTFTFSHVVKSAITVGEIGVGSTLRGVPVLASLTYVKDGEGQPTSFVLLPGDTIEITWALEISDAREGSTGSALNKLVDFTNSSGDKGELDYETLAVYPNWQLMGFRRNIELTLERNKIITNSEWECNIGKIINNYWVWYDWKGGNLTIDQINGSDMIFKTDSELPGYVPSMYFYLANIAGPIKFIRNDNYSPVSQSTTKQRLGKRFEKSHQEYFGNKFYPVEVENKITEFSYALNYINLREMTLDVHTVPYAHVTVYRADRIYQVAFTDIRGKATFSVPYTTDEFTIKAEIEDHFVFEKFKPSTTPFNNPLAWDITWSSYRLFYYYAPAHVYQTYTVTYVDKNGTPKSTYDVLKEDSQNNYSTVQMIWTFNPHLTSWEVGDKLTVEVKQNNVPFKKFEYVHKEPMNTYELHEAHPRGSFNDILIGSITKLDN